jgi:hypothetical protein
MNFNSHSHLEGQHAFLSASKYHWINYDEEKLIATYSKFQAAQRGTDMHALAAQLIKLGVKLPKNGKTFNMYVNDAIGFKMQPEQVLYYSDNCFGTADTINFKSNFLRVHDLKNGESPTSIKHLIIYEALFCLEYNIKPSEIESELRIYQSDDIQVHRPEPEEVFYVMDKIITFDKRIDQLKIGG